MRVKAARTAPSMSVGERVRKMEPGRREGGKERDVRRG